MDKSSFCVFILSYKRATEQKTLESLIAHGYSGDWYIVCDDTDIELEEYKNIYSDKVLVFSKEKYHKNTDTLFNSPTPSESVVYARNFALDIARKLGYDYAFMMDDDLTGFVLRYERDMQLKSCKVTDMDSVLSEVVRFQKMSKISVLGLTWSNLLIGGAAGRYKDGLIDVVNGCMSVDVSAGLSYKSIMGEDLISMADMGRSGRTFFSVSCITYSTAKRGGNAGGSEEFYKTAGDWVKFFMPVIFSPWCNRLYANDHSIGIETQKNTLHPKILNERWKK